jgi:hypothetical protein
MITLKDSYLVNIVWDTDNKTLKSCGLSDLKRMVITIPEGFDIEKDLIITLNGMFNYVVKSIKYEKIFSLDLYVIKLRS